MVSMRWIRLSRIFSLIRAEVKILHAWVVLHIRGQNIEPSWVIPSLNELMFNLLVPIDYKIRAGRYIADSRIENEEMLSVTIKDFGTLYIPQKAWKQLLQVLSEQLYQLHWDYPFFGGAVISEEDVVVDCGAAEGFFTLMATKKAAKVHAIEPIPQFYRCLEKSFCEYGKVILHNVAVGGRDGHITMLVDGIRSRKSNNLQGIRVPMVTLDSLLMDEKVDFIKVDVEGLEEDVLKGATNIIRKWKPKMAIAAYHDTNNPIQLKQLVLGIRSDYNIALRGINYKNGLPKFLYAW